MLVSNDYNKQQPYFKPDQSIVKPRVEQEIVHSFSTENLSLEGKRKLYTDIALLTHDIWKIKTFRKQINLLPEKEKNLQTLLTQLPINKDANNALWEALNESYIPNQKKINDAIIMGADLNLCDAEGRLPLHKCTTNFDVFKSLLDAGADPLIKDRDGMNALFHVTDIALFEEIFSRISLSSKEALAIRDYHNRTPLCCFVKEYFVRSADKKVIGYLKQKGADIHAEQYASKTSILHIAAESKCSVGLMEELIFEGANPNSKEGVKPSAVSPLYKAFLHKNFEGALLLLDYNAKVDFNSFETAIGMIASSKLPQELEETYQEAQLLINICNIKSTQVQDLNESESSLEFVFEIYNIESKQLQKEAYELLKDDKFNSGSLHERALPLIRKLFSDDKAEWILK